MLSPALGRPPAHPHRLGAATAAALGRGAGSDDVHGLGLRLPVAPCPALGAVPVRARARRCAGRTACHARYRADTPGFSNSQTMIQLIPLPYRRHRQTRPKPRQK